MLEQVTSVLLAIDEAVGLVDMAKAMEAGGVVLKGLNEEVGGVERVEGIMEGVRRAVEEVEDVGRVIAETAVEGVDENEVDEEMERLEREEGARVEAQSVAKTSAALPEVPQGLKHAEGVSVPQKAERDMVKRLSVMSVDEGEAPLPVREREREREAAQLAS